MSEGKQYKCDVESTATSVTMWVRSRGIRVVGPNWDDAYERLICAIINKTGDGEPKVSFAGPFPTQAEDRPYLAQRWTLIYPRGNCMTRWMNPLLFSRGACDLCGSPCGSRNRTQLEGVSGSSGDVCSAWAVWDEIDRTVRVQHGYSPLFVSERFLDLLNEHERSECDWLPVLPARRSRARYFECVPRRFLREVGHRNWDAYCVKCDECGNIDLRTSPTGRMNDFSKCRIMDWFAKDDFQRANERPLVAAGYPGDYLLAWPLERAKQLAQSRHAIGFSLGPIGVIPRAELLRRPTPTLFSKEHPDEFREYRRQARRR